MNPAGSASNWGTTVYGGIENQQAQPGGNLISMNPSSNCGASGGGKRKRRRRTGKSSSSRKRRGTRRRSRHRRRY